MAGVAEPAEPRLIHHDKLDPELLKAAVLSVAAHLVLIATVIVVAVFKSPPQPHPRTVYAVKLQSPRPGSRLYEVGPLGVKPAPKPAASPPKPAAVVSKPPEKTRAVPPKNEKAAEVAKPPVAEPEEKPVPPPAPKPVAKAVETPKPKPAKEPVPPAAEKTPTEPAPRPDPVQKAVAKPVPEPKPLEPEPVADTVAGPAPQPASAPTQDDGAQAPAEADEEEKIAAVAKPQVGEASSPDSAGGLGGESPAQGVGGKSGGADNGLLRGLEFVAYYDAMISEMRERWVWTGARDSGLAVSVRFSILADGRLTGVRLISSSGNLPFDRSVENAVRGVGKLPPPPHRYRKEFSDVELVFKASDLGQR